MFVFTVTNEDDGEALELEDLRVALEMFARTYDNHIVLVGSKTLARGGLSAEEIKKFDAYTLGFVTEQRKRERK